MEEQNKRQENLFSALRRLFSTDVVIRNDGKDTLKVIDTDAIQQNGVLQNNALVDRFNKIYTTSTSYGVNLNLAQNYQSARVQIYADYDAMDTDAIIASSLDVISDECTLRNEYNQVLKINSSDESIQKHLENLFYSVMNIEFNLWSWIRNMCKYGDFYLKLEISEKYGVYNVIPFSAFNILREEGFDENNPSAVRFKFDPTAALGSATGYSSATSGDNGIIFDNYEMAHFRLIGDVNYLPYGRSYLEPARKLFKQYTLIEDAMLIHRITRAPERRTFYVNVGAIPPTEVENYIQRMISKMKRTPLIDPQTGQYNLKYNQQNLLEDFFIPVRGNDQSTRIDTAKGLEYNAIEDVQYFRDKLFAALKVPKAYLGYEKDLSGKATLAAEDIRFARTVERIQQIVLSELKKIALVHLYACGYTDSSAANFELSLTGPSIIYDQERIAIFKEKLDTARSAVEDNIFPMEYVWENIFKVSPDSFGELEDMIAEDQKRKFRYKQISEEGNDPVESGKAYGTPHQIASLYGGSTTLDVPDGYNENLPKQEVGRPTEKNSIVGKDDRAFGRDALGSKENRGGQKSNNSIGLNFKDNSPLALETTMTAYLKNKTGIESLYSKMKDKKKKALLKEDDTSGTILDENNIID